MSKFTPWFKGSVKPVRKGMYEIKYDFCGIGHMGWSYWNGVQWGSRNGGFSVSFDARSKPALGPIRQWRGLTRSAT